MKSTTHEERKQMVDRLRLGFSRWRTDYDEVAAAATGSFDGACEAIMRGQFRIAADHLQGTDQAGLEYYLDGEVWDTVDELAYSPEV